MKLIEKLAEEYKSSVTEVVVKEFYDLKRGTNQTTFEADVKSAFEAGFRKAREMVLCILDEVGPGAADTMGVPRDLGESEVQDGHST